MTEKIDLSIVVPVYFNAGSLQLLHMSLTNDILAAFPNLKYEIIFIDDGSRDGSYKEMQAIKAKDPNVKLIKFTRNFGQVSAIMAGYDASNASAVLNVAADLQEPKDLIIDIIHSFLNKDAKIIAGKRIDRQEGFFRKITSKLFYSFMRKMSFSNMPRGGFDVVLLDDDVKNFILKSNETHPFWQGQILWSGFSVKFIPYIRQPRKIGKSKWTFGMKTKYLLDGALNYSYLPLRFFSLVGVISFILGIIYSVIIIISYFMGDSPFKGWAPIMIVILLFSGLQLIMTGLIGEYLWRTFEQTKQRPKYIIEEKK